MSTGLDNLPGSVLPLEAGDHLTREQFEERYEAMPLLKKAELLKGIVYVPSPVRLELHAEPHSLLVTWLGVYAAHTPGVRAADNATVRLGRESEPQPDALLMTEEGKGGQARVGPDGYVEGAPQLVAEVAASSASYDLHVKREVYEEHGVREDVVWRVLDRRVDWFVLRRSRFMLAGPDAGGVLRSEAFPGLRLDPAALLAGDARRVLKVLQAGLESPEHAAFCRELAG